MLPALFFSTDQTFEHAGGSALGTSTRASISANLNLKVFRLVNSESLSESDGAF